MACITGNHEYPSFFKCNGCTNQTVGKLTLVAIGIIAIAAAVMIGVWGQQLFPIFFKSVEIKILTAVVLGVSGIVLPFASWAVYACCIRKKIGRTPVAPEIRSSQTPVAPEIRSSQTAESAAKKGPPKPQDYIFETAAMPVKYYEYEKKRIHFMEIHIRLDDIITSNAVDDTQYHKYLDTLITCMQALQAFDQNLVFGVVFEFRDENISLNGQGAKLQAFAEIIFHSLIEKYNGNKTPEDDSQKLNLLSVVYNHPPLQEIVWEWVEKAKLLIDLAAIAENLDEEDESVDAKLKEFMNKYTLYDLNRQTFTLTPVPYYPLERIMEALSAEMQLPQSRDLSAGRETF